jgi:hypothetical protein
MTTTATPAVKATVIISDSRLIADNLLDGLTIKEKTAQIRALSAMDKAQLGSGIRNGTWTYDDV